MRRTRIPDDFGVSDRIMELAKQNGWPDPRKQIDAFKDYHTAHGTVMADWEAAFRTWLRNALAWGRGKPIKYERPAVRSTPMAEEIRDPKARGLLLELANKFDARKKA